jgi:SagB-type dehydrogenase family enzyme
MSEITRFLIMIIFLYPSIILSAQDIQLPPPQREGGMPLMEALNNRQSTRVFTDQELPIQTLSDLLWAAWGINRPDITKRTAPSANNRQNIELYCALRNGLYIYDAQANSLIQVIAEDIRAVTGTQEYVAGAALNIVFVAKAENAINWSEAEKKSACVNAAFIAQNVYLFCASEGLGCVVRGSFDGQKLQELMKLGNDKTAVLAQSVGYPGVK